jgi:hypothetical protein
MGFLKLGLTGRCLCYSWKGVLGASDASEVGMREVKIRRGRTEVRRT